jgi:hypothetical protein
MPYVINRETGKRYTVTDEHLKAIRSNPMTANAFDFEDDYQVIPEAIKKHRESKLNASEPAENTQTTVEEVKTQETEENKEK